MGKPTETLVYIGGLLTPVLLDTGSTVTTISENYYREHLTTPLHKLETLLDIECADGQQLPYLGYTEIEIQLPGQEQKNQCITLVTPNSRYNHHVPVLLGTNALTTVLESMKGKYGDRFLQNSKITTSWYLSLRCIILREKELKKNNNRLAIVKNAEVKKIIVPPNSTVMILRYVDKEIPYQTTPAMLHSSPLAKDFEDFDVEPSLITYQHKQHGHINVRLSNTTTRTISIPPKAVVCEIQPVILEEQPEIPTESETTKIMNQIKITQSDLTDQQLDEGV